MLDFYGAAGKDNGVNVSFASMKPGVFGSTDMGKNGSINIKFDLNQINSIGSNSSLGRVSAFGERAAIAIHEGTHGVDERNWGHNPLTDKQEDWTEHNAYRNQSYTYQGLDWPTFQGLWYRGMTGDQRSAAIDAGAKGSDAAACGGNPCN